MVQQLPFMYQNETILKYSIDVNAFLYWPETGLCVKNSEMFASSLLLGQTTRSYLFHAMIHIGFCTHHLIHLNMFYEIIMGSHDVIKNDTKKIRPAIH